MSAKKETGEEAGGGGAGVKEEEEGRRAGADMACSAMVRRMRRASVATACAEASNLLGPAPIREHLIPAG